MSKEIVLTGITTTGIPHLGNYVGAIRPAIEASRQDAVQSFYFLADFHALIKAQDADRVHESTREVAAAWLACGLDTDRAVFYRQSDIKEIPELTWLLTCMTSKGLMNRAHAYKAAVDANVEQKAKDADKGVTMGLFCYPVLMAADILMFNANRVPVGRDQIQHLEMARDIAQRFNHHYGEHFVMPEAQCDDNVAVLSGLDGRKMSKSYNNTIPLFSPEKKLRKLINKIKTDSSEPGDPKNPDESTLYEIYRAFASKEECEEVRRLYAEGIGWGDMKKLLFEKVNEEITPHRERYEALMADPSRIEKALKEGAEKAREYSRPMLEKLRHAVGIRPIA